MKETFVTVIASALTICLLHFSAPDAGAASGSALSLDGVNDYASVPDNNSLDLGTADGQGFTIETWFYVPDLNGEGLQTLIYKQSAYALFINFHTSQADQMFFRLWSLALPAPGYVTLYASPSALSVGWHHAAAIFDNQPGGGNDTAAVYLDGSRIGLGTGLNFNPGIGNSSSPLYLGAYAGVNPFHGWIDEARLSDFVRYSGTSYSVPAAPFVSDANTRALWHFDETAGSTSFGDSSANGNNLTGFNGAQTENPSPAVPPYLTNPLKLADGPFQFGFTNSPGAPFTVLAATNLTLPLSNWTVLGGVTEVSPGQFQFTDPQATNNPRRFYRIHSP